MESNLKKLKTVEEKSQNQNLLIYNAKIIVSATLSDKEINWMLVENGKIKVFSDNSKSNSNV